MEEVLNEKVLQFQLCLSELAVFPNLGPQADILVANQQVDEDVLEQEHVLDLRLHQVEEHLDYQQVLAVVRAEQLNHEKDVNGDGLDQLGFDQN